MSKGKLLILLCCCLLSCSKNEQKTTFRSNVTKEEVKSNKSSSAQIAKNMQHNSIINAINNDDIDYSSFNVNDRNYNAHIKNVSTQDSPSQLLAKHNLALLLPLSGNDKEFGKKILVSCAQSLVDSKNNEIGIFVFDTQKYKGKEEECVKKIKRNNCLAVVGPVFSSDIKTYYFLLGGQHSVPMFAFTGSLNEANKNLFPCASYKEAELDELFEFAINNLGINSITLVIPRNTYGETVKLLAGKVFNKKKLKQNITVITYDGVINDDVLRKSDEVSRADAFFIADPTKLPVLANSTKVLLTDKSVHKLDLKLIPDNVYFCSEIKKDNKIASNNYDDIAYDIIQFIARMNIGDYVTRDLKDRDDLIHALSQNTEEKDVIKTRPSLPNASESIESKLSTDSSLHVDKDTKYVVNPTFQKSIVSKKYFGEKSGYYKFFINGQVAKKKKIFVVKNKEIDIVN